MSLNPADFNFVRALLRERSAIVLDDEKAYLAECRLSMLAQRERLGSTTDLVARLRGGQAGGLAQQVVEALVTNETYFFRDLHPFECLRQTVLPELLRRRAGERRLNVWCSACASGQEPYSVAMLLCEHFPALDTWDVRLLGSDLSRAMVERARQGRYTQLEVNRGLPARLLVKYFQKDGAGWQVKEAVRRLVEFSEVNLVGAWPAFPLLDVVLLRNVLIYFDVATKKQVLGRVRRLLRPDGFLFLGAVESTLGLEDAFERVPFDRSGCYRLRPA